MWDALRHGVTSTFTYCDADFLLAESEASETLTELCMTWTCDNALRRAVVAAKSGASVLPVEEYVQDIAGRQSQGARGALLPSTLSTST